MDNLPYFNHMLAAKVMLPIRVAKAIVAKTLTIAMIKPLIAKQMP